MTPAARSVILRRRPNLAALDIVGRLGLRGSLELCLDAGDAASYASGASWLDRSGNGYDFFLGDDGTATGTDPAFSGTAGGLSSGEYFGVDGGDYFTYDTTNEAWMENIHKDNAAFTSLEAVYLGSVGVTSQVLWTTGVTSFATVGARLLVGPAGNLLLQVGNGGGTAYGLTATTSYTVTAGRWLVVAVSLDEAAGVGTITVNDQSYAFSAGYTSPSAGSAAAPLRLGAHAVGSLSILTGGRHGMHMFWSRALQLGEIGAIYTSLRRRYGI